jgi:hypothetical protein
MNDSFSPSASKPDNTRRNVIIAVVIILLLLCCCCGVVIFGYLAWQCGDALNNLPTPGCPIPLSSLLRLVWPL